jgi:hypothetical protein
MRDSHDRFPWDLLIPILPQLIALLLLVGLLVMIGPRRIAAMARRIKKIGFAGLEIELEEIVRDAAEHRGGGVSPAQADRAAHRLAQAATLLSCTRLLWVDDAPEGNVLEIKALRRLCVAIDLAQSNEDARRALSSGIYDLVISDIERESEGSAGMAMVNEVQRAPFPPILIYYVGRERPLPEGAFGLTTRPDELFHLIVDALSRRKG